VNVSLADVKAQAARDAAGLAIRARRDVARAWSGPYRSAQRGRGLIFDELRDYVPGDDAQSIEWNATARLARPIVKQMREERDLCVALLVDVSRSVALGFGAARAASLARAAAALATSAIRARDQVALALFAGASLETLRPRSGPAQLERVLRALERTPDGEPSDLRPALAWALAALPPHSIVCVLSDGFLGEPGALLARCARAHELIVLRVVDAIDAGPPGRAPVRVRGAEGASRGLWSRRSAAPEPLAEERWRASGVEIAPLRAGDELGRDLRAFFAQRPRSRT
jgi:uncharacterized protein (DUF58 family)